MEDPVPPPPPTTRVPRKSKGADIAKKLSLLLAVQHNEPGYSHTARARWRASSRQAAVYDVSALIRRYVLSG